MILVKKIFACSALNISQILTRLNKWLSLNKPAVFGFSENRLIKQNEKSRKDIINLQSAMEEMESTLDDFPVSHHFAPGVYARQMFLPKSNVIIGKIHKHAHLNILSKGKVAVSTEGGLEEITAPATFTSYAGTKRAVHVIEDTIWTTIHVTNETNLDKIEDEVIAKDFDEIDKIGEQV